jgi:hypothetical protein
VDEIKSGQIEYSAENQIAFYSELLAAYFFTHGEDAQVLSGNTH